MQNSNKPPFILGIVSHIALFFGLGMKSYGNEYADHVIVASFILGGIFWIWSILSVVTTNDLKKYQKTFWLIIVVAVPMFGGLIYQILHQRRNKIAA